MLEIQLILPQNDSFITDKLIFAAVCSCYHTSIRIHVGRVHTEDRDTGE